MEFCLAKVEDLNEIYTLELESFKHPFKKEDLLYEIKDNPVSKFLLLKENNEIIGFIDFWITFDSGTICQICVKKDRKRQGFATILLNKAVEMLKNESVEFLTLEVRESNTPARSFYEKNAFTKITIKPAYYDDGEDAIYMMRGLI